MWRTKPQTIWLGANLRITFLAPGPKEFTSEMEVSNGAMKYRVTFGPTGEVMNIKTMTPEPTRERR